METLGGATCIGIIIHVSMCGVCEACDVCGEEVGMRHVTRVCGGEVPSYKQPRQPALF